MPAFIVTIEDTIDETIEEIWHAYRTNTHIRLYRVEAEDENEAREIAEDYGNLISEDYDYGDIYDSEYYDTVNDSIYGELADREISVEEDAKPKPPKPDWRI